MKLCGFSVGLDRPLFLIAGPRVIESRQLAMDTAGTLEALCAELGVPFIYKSSYDKANRSSGKSFRGLGMEKGLAILAEVRKAIGVPVLTDVHEIAEVPEVAAVGDVLQTPAFLFHTDAVQAAGEIPLDVRKTPIAMLTISGHKLHAPKGIGALYIRKGTRFHPYIIGGHQEHGRRAGTENVASIIGFGKAAELARTNLAAEIMHLSRLRDRLEQGLLNSCSHARVNGDIASLLPNTANISFEYIEGEAILLRLNEYGICASSGSACTSGSLEPSHVLRAMGVPYTAVHGSIRFSLSRYTTDKDIDRVLEVMPNIIRKLRELSPFGREHTVG